MMTPNDGAGLGFDAGRPVTSRRLLKNDPFDNHL
jgi:hypothetical protein